MRAAMSQRMDTTMETEVSGVRLCVDLNCTAITALGWHCKSSLHPITLYSNSSSQCSLFWFTGCFSSGQHVSHFERAPEKGYLPDNNPLRPFLDNLYSKCNQYIIMRTWVYS